MDGWRFEETKMDNLVTWTSLLFEPRLFLFGKITAFLSRNNISSPLFTVYLASNCCRSRSFAESRWRQKVFFDDKRLFVVSTFRLWGWCDSGKRQGMSKQIRYLQAIWVDLSSYSWIACAYIRVCVQRRTVNLRYWPSVRFRWLVIDQVLFCVFMDREEEVNKNGSQYLAILTKQFFQDQRGKSRRAGNRPISSTQVANQNTLFALSYFFSLCYFFPLQVMFFQIYGTSVRRYRIICYSSFPGRTIRLGCVWIKKRKSWVKNSVSVRGRNTEHGTAQI